MAEATLTLDLEAFQGPFDLLLHLIKEQDIDINDIPMTQITEQYLKYIKQMEHYQLDVIGDYLVMAASLLEIKSKLLLPIEPLEDFDDDYDDEDPRAQLVQQLLLYQQFQSVSTELEELSEKRQKVYTRPTEDLSHLTQFVPLDEGEITLDQLVDAMNDALEKFQKSNPAPQEIHTDTVTVGEQIDYLMECLSKSEHVTFSDTLVSGSRPEIISTFLAMLELVRKDIIVFKQEARVGEIYMTKTGR